MIKQLLNSVIAKRRDLSLSRRSIICRSRRLTQTIDLLASNKSRSGYRKKPHGYSLCWSIRGTFAISLAEVYERVGKSVISVGKRLKNANR